MSEQQIQREPLDHLDVPNEAPVNDPLAELAKIVAGEVPGARKEVVNPIPAAPVAQTPVAPVSQPPMQAAGPVQVVEMVPEYIPTPAPLPVATDFHAENMDLESQLLAELGVGEPEIAAAPVIVAAPEPIPATTVSAVTPVVEPIAELPAANPVLAGNVEIQAPVHSPQQPDISLEPAMSAQIPAEEISSDEFSDVFSAHMSGGEEVEQPSAEPTTVAIPIADPIANPVDALPPISQSIETALQENAPHESDPVEPFDLEEEMAEFSTDAFADLNDEPDAASDEPSIEALEPVAVETEQYAAAMPISHEPDPVAIVEVTPVATPEQNFDAVQASFENQVAADQANEHADISAHQIPEAPLAAPAAPSMPVTENPVVAAPDFDDGFSEAFGDELDMELSVEEVVETQPLQQVPAEPPQVQNDEFEAAMFALHQNEIEAPQPAPVHQPAAPQPVAANLQVGIAPTHSQPVPPAPEQFYEPQSFQPIDTHADASNVDPMAQETEVVLPPVRRKFGVGLAASALGLALVAGIGFVGYGYFTDSNTVGEPAVVRADPGDFKIKPKAPGGKKIANQDQPVYDSIAGDKSKKTDQESLVVANVEPIEIATDAPKTRSFKSSERLATTDNAQPANSAVAAMQPRKVKTVTVRADGTIVTSTGNEIANLTAFAATEQDVAAIAEPVVASTNSIDGASTTGDIAVPSLSPNRKPAASSAIADDEAIVLATAVPVTAVKTTTRSLRTPEIVAPKPVSVTTIKPAAPLASVPVTNAEFVVQISSQRSQEAAEATYQNLKRRFASLLSDRSREIKEAKVEGKGTFYRVRIPVGSKTAAADFCGRYKSAGGSCFVTR